MLDLDGIVEQCVAAAEEAEPKLAVKDVLERAVREGTVDDVGARGGLNILYRSPNLTVIDFVWPPMMKLYPHDHRMWAAIGIYGGREDNAFFRREGDTIVPSGGRELHERDVVLLGSEAIHAVHNPSRNRTGAIHVYGGDFVAQPRSQWDPESLLEEPFDLDEVLREFERAEEAASLDA